MKNYGQKGLGGVKYRFFFGESFFNFSKMDKNKCPKSENEKNFPKKSLSVTIKKIMVRFQK
jgi:hypothetical protein